MQVQTTTPECTQQQTADSAATIKALGKHMYTDPARVIQEGELLLEQATAQVISLDAMERMRVLFYCSIACHYLDDMPRMDYYVECCRQLYSQLHRVEDRCWYLGHIAVNSDVHRRVDEAIDYAEQAITLAEENGLDDEVIYQALHILALIHYNLGNYDISLMYSLRLQRCVEKAPLITRDCKFYHNLGLLYKKLDRYGDAKSCFQKSMALARKGKLPIPQAMTLNTIGNLYFDSGQMEKALKCVNKSIALAKACNLQDLAGLNTMLKARILIALNEQDKAKQMLDHLLDTYRDDLIRYNVKAECLEQLGVIQQQKGNNAAARDFFSRMLDSAVAAGLRYKQAEACQRLCRLEEQCGNYDRALQYHKIATQVWHTPGIPELQQRITALSSMQQNKAAATTLPLQMGDPTILQVLNKVSSLANSVNQSGHNGRMNNAGEAEDLPKENYAFLAGLKHKLLNKASDLTATEIRICLLIASGLQSKEVAELLVNSVTTINTHRRHIRKKLLLTPGSNLATYFTSL